MDNRRTTRTRNKRPDEGSNAPTPSRRVSTASVPNATKRASPGIKQQISPTSRHSPGGHRSSPSRAKRVSSRPRSTTLGMMSAQTLNTLPSASPMKEVRVLIKPSSSPPKASAAVTSFTRAPLNQNTPTVATIVSKTQSTDRTTSTSQYSTYSSVTNKTTEINASGTSLNADIAKLGDYLRRSVSRNLAEAADLVRRSATRTPSDTIGTNTDADSRYSRSLSRSVYEDDEGAEFSDNDNDDDNDAQQVTANGEGGDDEPYKSFNSSMLSATLPSTAPLCRQLAVPREFGGWLGASLLLLLLPPLLYYLQRSCGEKECAFVVAWPQLQLQPIRSLQLFVQSLFRFDAVLAFVAFNVGIFVLSALVPGRYVQLPREVRSPSYVQYQFNVAPMAVLLTLAAIATEWRGYALVDFVLRNYVRFNVYALLNAFVMAAWCYVRLRVLPATSTPRDATAQLNVYAKSGNFVVDYALGRELNPKWLDFVNYKQVFHRIALLTTLLYAGCFIYKNVEFTGEWMALEEIAEDPIFALRYYAAKIKYDPTSLLAATLLLTYVCDGILFEHHLASSFELQGEGFGALLLLRYAATPQLLAGVAHYCALRQIPFTCQWAGYVAAALLLVGLSIKRYACAVKYKYRIFPSHALFARAETVHTFQGRRLLLGALWGRLRQPNYAGDILALAGLAVPLFMQFAWPPFVGLLLIVVLLVHRALRVNARNKARYQSSWMSYCNRARHYIVPFVY